MTYREYLEALKGKTDFTPHSLHGVAIKVHLGHLERRNDLRLGLGKGIGWEGLRWLVTTERALQVMRSSRRPDRYPQSGVDDEGNIFALPAPNTIISAVLEFPRIQFWSYWECVTEGEMPIAVPFAPSPRHRHTLDPQIGVLDHVNICTRDGQSVGLVPIDKVELLNIEEPQKEKAEELAAQEEPQDEAIE